MDLTAAIRRVEIYNLTFSIRWKDLTTVKSFVFGTYFFFETLIVAEYLPYIHIFFPSLTDTVTGYVPVAVISDTSQVIDMLFLSIFVPLGAINVAVLLDRDLTE